MMISRSKWIQRDLEDQIHEEYKNQGKEYLKTQLKNKKMTKEIKIPEVLALLKQGYKRWTKEELEPGKSIQTHYNLTFTECKAVFQHPKVKGLKTKKPTIILVDEEVTQENSPKEVVIKAEQTLEEKMKDIFN